MTIIQDRPATETSTCPVWCTEHMDPNPLDFGETPIIHQRPVGALGVAVVKTEDEPVMIYVPELDVDQLNASPAFARQLGADLIAAADLLDGATA